ncbi:shikimate kinase 2 [Salmonella enterica subsp. enterica serovar Choleraesuis]|nr:shikimate kinase 2 [Salmonella enterica subsp. enterica serovar Choleraesuis]
MTQPIFLVGARGCGKTTVGKTLAAQLGWEFADTDNWLLETSRKTVAEMVAESGWPAFRQLESQALPAVTVADTVIATGGGMVLAAENRQYMRAHGSVIWLRAPAQILAGRLEEFPENGQRPTLTGQPITDEIVEVLAARESLYREAAHHVVDATGTPQQVVSEILRALSLPEAV